jgi:DNA-binding transcriptional ArsR family regulator
LIERDVEPKEGLLRVTTPRDALRVFTNGVDVDPSGWADEIIVVPTVALRPFIAPVESGARLILVCSVADESFDIDAAAPPRRLVLAAAALGDALRLRILRELGEGDLTATQLAERLGVDRTSLHHHLGILRSAGLVAVRAEGVQSWRYSLRGDGLAGTSAALTGYLRPRA